MIFWRLLRRDAVVVNFRTDKFLAWNWMPYLKQELTHLQQEGSQSAFIVAVQNKEQRKNWLQ